MRIVASVVARLPPDRVWAWWTDYGPTGHKERVDHGLGSSTREVVASLKDRVILRESFLGSVGAFDHEITLFPEQRRLEERNLRGAPVHYSSKWRFESENGGAWTRITRELDVDVDVPGFLQEFGNPITRKAVERDMETHVKQMESELGVA